MAGKKKDQCNINPEKHWGGKREGGGFPAKWKHGNSKPIRIPEALHEAVLAYAHALDKGQTPNTNQEPEAQPTEQNSVLAPDKLKALLSTQKAISQTLEEWRQEFRKHDPNSPRWKKAHQLFTQLEESLKNS